MDSAFGHNFHQQSDNSTARIIASAKQAVLTPGEMPKLPKRCQYYLWKLPHKLKAQDCLCSSHQYWLYTNQNQEAASLKCKYAGHQGFARFHDHDHNLRIPCKERCKSETISRDPTKGRGSIFKMQHIPCRPNQRVKIETSGKSKCLQIRKSNLKLIK